MTNQIIAVVILSVVLKYVSSQSLPANPCPNLFQYFQNNGAVYGRMEFQNDLTGYYRLTVNMSVAAYILDNSRNIQLELRTSANDIIRGRPLVYYVYFPLQEVIPKPTRIEFNRRVYCAGPPEEVRPGRGVTNMWATTYYRITIPNRPLRPNSVDIEVVQIPEITAQLPPGTFDVQQVPTFTLPSGFFDNIPVVPSTTSTTPAPTPAPTTAPTPAPTPAATPAPTPSTTIPPSSTNPVLRPSTIATNVIDRNPAEDQCGLLPANAQQLIIKGESIADGQYPWLVAMMYRNNFDYKYKCTGSLVSNRHVITAGHCVQYNYESTKVPLFNAEDLLLVFGKNNIEGWANGALLRDVEKISVHPEYKQNKGDSDIAVLTVQKPIQFDPEVRPVCLWQEDDNLDRVVGVQGTVVGWGTDGTGKEFVADAKKVTLPVVSQVTCLRSHPGFSSITSNRTFCAGNRNGSGPCYGDSGAGFVINRNGRWTIRGVVSTALGDVGVCDLNNYFVFADVAKLISWIREVMA